MSGRPAGTGVGAKTVGTAAAALALVLGAAAAMTAVVTAGTATAGAAGGGAVARWRTREIARPADGAGPAVLGRPLALAFDGGTLFVADAQDCAVKTFTADGAFAGAFGRKGKGPGELSFPSGVAVAGDKVFVADKLNSRIQVFGRDGRPRTGFALPFPPDKVLALADGSLLVTRNPSGRRSGETLLQVYDGAGGLRWQGLEARLSGDPAFDAFANMILVGRVEGGDLFVVFRSGERALLRFAASGALRARIAVDDRHPLRPLDLPFKGGRKRLLGFCWAAAADGGLFFLSAPEPVEGRDLGPGREISVVDGLGGLRAVVELGRPVHRFVVDGGRIFAIDEEGELAIFEVER